MTMLAGQNDGPQFRRRSGGPSSAYYYGVGGGGGAGLPSASASPTAVTPASTEAFRASKAA